MNPLGGGALLTRPSHWTRLREGHVAETAGKIEQGSRRVGGGPGDGRVDLENGGDHDDYER